MKRIVCSWTGPSVKGLAVTIFHFLDSEDSPTEAARVFFYGVKDVIPTGVSIAVPNYGDVIDPVDGKLTDVWSVAAAGDNVPGFGPAAAAAGVGGVVAWGTSGIENGHRVRGRTFVVPISASSYEVDGTLTQTALNALNDGAGQLRAAKLCIWHRPTSKGAQDGSMYPVESHLVKDRVAFLSSRRD